MVVAENSLALEMYIDFHYFRIIYFGLFRDFQNKFVYVWFSHYLSFEKGVTLYLNTVTCILPTKDVSESLHFLKLSHLPMCFNYVAIISL